MSDPEYVRSLQTEWKRQRCRETACRPDMQAKHSAAIEKRRALGFPELTYRNGLSGPTIAQKMLFEALPAGAMMELPISVGNVGAPFRADIAIPSLELAVEVDGHSHSAQWRKDIDARKEQVLRERGWVVLRFSNSEIVRHLPWVLEKIQEKIRTLEARKQ